jgi:hypothetical protein
LAAVALVVAASATAAFYVVGSDHDDLSAGIMGMHILPLNIQYQHKDSNFVCEAGPPCPGGHPDPAHEWNDTAGPDGIYGNSDDCPHCSAYSAPAAIAMIADSLGRSGNFMKQDPIYDNGKSVAPEITGDNIIQTHGVGMFDGTNGWPSEVQTAFEWALGVASGYEEHGPGNPMTDAHLEEHIKASRVVLWIDHGGWPANQSASYPSTANKADQGHAKVIAGYDDKNTPGHGDDWCLIYDPWPEYTDKGILPENATLGPGGTYDPYWIPLRDVNTNDTADMYLVPVVSIPEFSSVVVPICGMVLVLAVISRLRGRSDEDGLS